MARLRYRWLLPLGHALVDVIFLSHFIWLGYEWQSAEKPCPHVPVVQSRTPAQEPWLGKEEGIVGWSSVDLWDADPWDLNTVAWGTPPAGLISHAVRPEAYIQDCTRLWDPVWFSIHEGVALLFWFLVGAWQDSPTGRFRKLLGVYLAVRFASAELCWTLGTELGYKAQGVFLGLLCILALYQGCPWLLRRLRTRP
jgi:hypothetical protein